MKITLLGTGNPSPSLKRAGAGVMVKIGDDIILLDHGPGAYNNMLRAGVQPTEVSHVMFSHLHYDHCVDFPRLLLTRWDHGAARIPELKIFGPNGTAEHVDRLIGPEGAYQMDIHARCNWPSSVFVYQQRGGGDKRLPPCPEVTEYKKGSVIDMGSWQVSVTEVPHAQPWLSCMAIRLDCAAGSVVFSGDSGPSKDLETLAKDCDILIHMCSTISGSVGFKALETGNSGHMQAARAAVNAGAKTLICSHIYDQFDLPGVREQVISDIKKIYDGNVVFGEDLLELGPRPYVPAKFE